MTAPIGATVSIVYDANDESPIVPGDYVRTRAGRCYHVLDARRVISVVPNRWRLSLIVIGEIPTDGDPAARVHPLVFYPRGK